MMKNDKKKECWICHRSLLGNQKLGLCPVCFNKGGTAVAIAAISVALRTGGKLAANLYKRIKG